MNNASVPLTLTLSRGEREQQAMSPRWFVKLLANTAIGFVLRLNKILPLPKGEGRGEGEKRFKLFKRFQFEILLVILALFFTAASSQSITASTNTIHNFAGTGAKGFSGDGGAATNAQLNFPTGLMRGPDGALYFCDTSNHRIRKISKDGKIVT